MHAKVTFGIKTESKVTLNEGAREKKKCSCLTSQVNLNYVRSKDEFSNPIKVTHTQTQQVTQSHTRLILMWDVIQL